MAEASAWLPLWRAALPAYMRRGVYDKCRFGGEVLMLLPLNDGQHYLTSGTRGGKTVMKGQSLQQ